MSAAPTNGIGKTCTSHLNLARTLAEVWADEPATPKDPTTPSTALHWSVPAYPNRFAASRRTFKD